MPDSKDILGHAAVFPNAPEPFVVSRYCPPRCQGVNHELFDRMVQVLCEIRAEIPPKPKLPLVVSIQQKIDALLVELEVK